METARNMNRADLALIENYSHSRTMKNDGNCFS